jgi:hypothetical protein
MAVFQSLRRNLSGRGAPGVVERRRVPMQGLRKRFGLDQALGKEEKDKAGIDSLRLGCDLAGKTVRIRLIRGERGKTACIVCPRAGQWLPPWCLNSIVGCACGFGNGAIGVTESTIYAFSGGLHSRINRNSEGCFSSVLRDMNNGSASASGRRWLMDTKVDHPGRFHVRRVVDGERKAG